jgi:hypothetical protein
LYEAKKEWLWRPVSAFEHAKAPEDAEAHGERNNMREELLQ